MTEEEIRKLYAIAMSYDNRRFSEANVTAWWEQAERCRWTFNDAREAIHQHHMQSTDFLMPAHVTAIIKADRRQPARVDETRQIEATPPAQPERVSSIVAELSRRLGWRNRAPREQDAAVLAVECPYCHVAPKRPCTRLATRGPHRGEYLPLGNFHPSRVEVARLSREEQQ